MVFTSQRLFGKAPAAAPTPAPAPTTTAVHDLSETLELCEKREAHVLRLVQKEVESARAHAAANNRKAALDCVKRKKIHEKELDRLSAQKLSLMEQESTLNALKFNSVVVDAHARGVQAIEREVQKVKGADGVDRVLDRLEDALDSAKDILDASSPKMGEAASLDEADLLEELEQMELADELCGITGVAGTSGAAAGSASGVPLMVPTPVPAPVPLAVPLAVPRASAAQVAKRAEEDREERELAELVALQSSMKIEQPMPMPMMAAVC